MVDANTIFARRLSGHSFATHWPRQPAIFVRSFLADWNEKTRTLHKPAADTQSEVPTKLWYLSKHQLDLTINRINFNAV